MFYYISEWFKRTTNWKKTKPEPETPTEQVDSLGEIIRKRALEQNSIIDRKVDKDEGDLKTLPFGTS